MRDVRERLRDILEAIKRIEKDSSQGRDAFFEDELIQTWVIRHLQIIGELHVEFLTTFAPLRATFLGRRSRGCGDAF